jgi:hypothetical protein
VKSTPYRRCQLRRGDKENGAWTPTRSGFSLPASADDHKRFASIPQNWRLFRDEKLCYLNPLLIILRTIAA